MHPLAEYIVENYSRAKKIVEVGVGRRREILMELKRNLRARVVGVDIRGEGLVIDDIFSPRVEIYRGADLIYSIRPEPELIPQLKKLAKLVGCDLIVRPMATDFLDSDFRLVNYKGEFFYIFEVAANQ